MKLTRGEGGSHGCGAHSRAAGARIILSRRAQLIRVFDGLRRTGEMLGASVGRLLTHLSSPRRLFGIGIGIAAFFLLGLWPPVMSPIFQALDWLAGPRGQMRYAILEPLGTVLLTVDMTIMILGLFCAGGLLWASVIGLWFWERKGKPPLSGALAVMIALGGNGLIAAFCARFFAVPPGASIRPMAEGVWVMMISVYTIGAVVGLFIYSFVRERGWSRLLAAAACPIAIETFFLGGQLLRWAAAMNHFSLSE
jgi:hypothetical protein